MVPFFIVLACRVPETESSMPQPSNSVHSPSKVDNLDAQQTVDIDGNIYDTIVIDGKRWLAQNLKVTRYRNGDPIEYKGSPMDWKKASTGLAAPFGNKEENIEYGLLYNFYAISDPRGLCPLGFRVPHNQEFASVFGPGSNFQDKGLGFHRIYDFDEEFWSQLKSQADEMSPEERKQMNEMFDLGDPSFQRKRENKALYWSQDTRDEKMKLAWIVSDADLGEYAWGAYVDGYSVRCIEE